MNRTRGERRYFIAPIDQCYRLTGVIRKEWRGFSGGETVWQEVDRFFESLQSAPVPDLSFAIEGAEPVTYAACPTLAIRLKICNANPDEQIQSVMLQAQVQIEATRRRYAPETSPPSRFVWPTRPLE